MKLSVIVPVYKAEKYLNECVDSLLNQTLGDLEILLVDDGSPDRSGEIMADYRARFPEKIRTQPQLFSAFVDAAREHGAAERAAQKSSLQ